MPACGTESSAGTDQGTTSPTAVLVGELQGRLTEFQEYASFVIANKVDAAKSLFWRALFTIVITVLSAFALCVLIACGCTFLMIGMAHGLALLFGTALWAGYAVVGTITLIAISGGLYVAIRRMDRRCQERIQARNEKRKAELLASSQGSGQN
jgi:phosphotransferase system  glucose/maltose/N-acetylglucosamine-specific IIC component